MTDDATEVDFEQLMYELVNAICESDGELGAEFANDKADDAVNSWDAETVNTFLGKYHTALDPGVVIPDTGVLDSHGPLVFCQRLCRAAATQVLTGEVLRRARKGGADV